MSDFKHPPPHPAGQKNTKKKKAYTLFLYTKDVRPQ